MAKSWVFVTSASKSAVEFVGIKDKIVWKDICQSGDSLSGRNTAKMSYFYYIGFTRLLPLDFTQNCKQAS